MTVSPLAAWRDRLAALAPVLDVAEVPFRSQLTVRVSDPDALAAAGSALGVPFPSAACTFTSGTGPFGDAEVLWLGPDEFLVTASPGLQVTIEEVLRGALGTAGGSVVDTSAQRTTVVLQGPLVRQVLAHGCSVDLHPSSAPVGTCVQTLLARTGIVLQVTGEDRCTILVRSSFAEYFAAWLADACTEYLAVA
ncbi:sarcosine oxidase subunit gamma [Lentzea sp. NEAU-D7]|uniref:sarcosine oxidase subunit gamma n=1 Tax=Lentzea sp. NEAU-D7 TaxID=2994667 RepID=UPI00224B4158|nr:sarcosine oxidase subunit gamma family protein [Lentzea sp. NEAU-D7]MCX2948693.1 sarcosine oxidase subunit gamma [Lentzea sp. NEAU-D7]MCX2951251.1 sarcosine oxidase subunit gamma [Lentzea sp. NEAU-D7]